MSFFFKPRSKTPQEVLRSTKDSLLALDTPTVVEVKALEKALEEVGRNLSTMRLMLCGDSESEPNTDQILQLTVEICNEDVIPLLVHKLHVFGWQARKDLVSCWSVLLKQQVDDTYCCIEYIENHLELLDFLVVCYDNKDAALTCGTMLRECIKFQTLAKYILESTSFELFFKYIELPNFDVASDAFATFKDLLTKHSKEVAEYLTSHYNEFFEMYEKLLTSTNYVTRRQSLKDSSKNIQLSAFHIFKVFVANPNKTHDIKIILAKNCEKLLDLLRSLSVGKGSEDEQFEEEKEMIMKEIERVSRFINRERC
uniref:Calcium-binding protein 39 n=1 Tax=Chenopodium quinoa TaxID=63459 RepID=A0A803L4Y3_CHEQI